MFWSGWLEIAVAGLVVAVIVNRGLSANEGAAFCATALAEGTRAAILRATCAAPSAAWARLLRGALREPASDTPIAGGSGYRDAPARTASDSVMQIFHRERARIRRRRAIGLAGAVAAIGGGAPLLTAQSVAMALVMLAAAVSAWRVVVNAQSAETALDEARSRVPDLVATVAPPPALEARAVEPAPSPVALRSSVGLLGGVLVLGFALIVVILGAGVLAELRHRVADAQIGLLFGIHVVLLPFTFALVALLRRVDAVIDVASGDLVLVHRLFGRTIAQTIVPLEIVRSFSIEGRRVKRLVVETTGGTVELGDGDRVDEAAAALNHALGRR